MWGYKKNKRYETIVENIYNNGLWFLGGVLGNSRRKESYIKYL